jgi:hypothetical protein
MVFPFEIFEYEAEFPTALPWLSVQGKLMLVNLEKTTPSGKNLWQLLSFKCFNSYGR